MGDANASTFKRAFELWICMGPVQWRKAKG
jgi:hypothetical protein